MSRNIKDWMIKEPVKGNHYKLWNLFPGSVFTISTPSGVTALLVNKQRGSLTHCQIFDEDTYKSGGEMTALDSSLIVTAVG